MRGIWAAVAAIFAAGAAAAPNDPPPDWAFVIYDPAPASGPKDKPVTVPGSGLRVTPKQIDDPFVTVDWFPGDHGRMPRVVEHGHAPKLWACSFCHAPTGVGGSDSAAIAGLPAAYIAEQFAEFRSGRRQCAVARDLSCSQDMPKMAAAAGAEEIKQAAAYFSALAYRSRVHVVEAATVPKTRPGNYFLVRRGGSEPIGDRIIELPDDAALESAGDWRDTVTAYVPPGSIARGRTLVASGAGSLPCASCHGAHFRGAGPIPPLAGRPPTYIVRQLYDIQYGIRRGPAVAPMLPEVAHLTARDRIAIAAYLASLK
jgi:cytochrome c553